MKRLLNLIERNIEKNIIPRLLYIDNFSRREYERDIYVDGQIYKENKIDLVFLVNTGDLFSKTIRFDIEVNTSSNFIKLRRGYGEDYIYFEKNEYVKIEEFILDEIIEFYLKDNKDYKKKINNNLNINNKKIV